MQELIAINNFAGTICNTNMKSLHIINISMDLWNKLSHDYVFRPTQSIYQNNTSEHVLHAMNVYHAIILVPYCMQCLLNLVDD